MYYNLYTQYLTTSLKICSMKKYKSFIVINKVNCKRIDLRVSLTRNKTLHCFQNYLLSESHVYTTKMSAYLSCQFQAFKWTLKPTINWHHPNSEFFVQMIMESVFMCEKYIYLCPLEYYGYYFNNIHAMTRDINVRQWR